MKHCLVAITPQGSGSRHELGREDVSIGKDPSCNIVIGGDDYVSRHHARIVRSNGLLFLEDTNSANGTSLRVRRPIILEPGDEIIIGTTTLRLEEVH